MAEAKDAYPAETVGALDLDLLLINLSLAAPNHVTL